MLLCRRLDLGFEGIKIDPDTSYVNGCHTYHWEETHGEEAIKKLQELMKNPIKCFLEVIICTGDNFVCSDAIKINQAEIDENGCPQVSFDFYDNGAIMGCSPTYYLSGWGVKETREVKVKEYHVKGDTIKNQATIKQLLNANCKKFEVVLEDGQTIPKESIRRIWLPYTVVYPDIPYRAPYKSFSGDICFVTYDGIKYCVKPE